MLNPNFVILYVANPLASADFYSNLLKISPVESSPTFVMFSLENGFRLGLWSRDTVEPAASPSLGGGSELAILVANPEAVHELYGNWQKRGLSIIQEPIRMDFGLNFVAVDHDGHRIRVYEHS
ncbi:VOC family protein [Legionella micdadei]|uniref:Glyoxalase-like domain-containing protein n=1 Tax=Legionella micdadei TaxID=451 RepID=A0A098GDX0_LEGMI|nr:VOC family protein [Legionella micdadei]ARG97749.1 hypothetical protein B6N58_08780 [Legionella micdadei]ARG99938.1 hypothetical protein B6V88_05640 [Legionella micdadei]KTD28452.1 bleomycin resistance protein [Legionella micdadei]NSL18776.1 VOC family protein [Legionella micdadei]CEG60658.1 conserved protein of unknown function [Legionella micdadei]